MGLPMATHLARDHEVIAFDVSPERLKMAELAGVRPAASPAQACADADVVLIGVRDAAQLERALFGPLGAAETLAAESVVILTSTVGRDAARDAADRLEEQGVLLIDAPVSGGPVRAGKGDLLIMVSAGPAALDRGRSVLEALSSTLTVAGPRVGDGQMLKTVNQLLCGVHTAAAAEALALAHALGLDLDSTLEVLGKGAAAVCTPQSSWFTVLSIWPSPTRGPATVSVEARASRTERPRSRAAGPALTMINRSPLPARTGPPLTGASMRSRGCSSSRSAASRAASRPTVEVRMTTAPAANVSAAPSSRARCSDRWALPRTPIRTTSAPAHAWAGTRRGARPPAR